MRFLIALALIGCDDGTGGPCLDVSGMEPDDYTDPAEIRLAEAEGVRECVVQLRLITAVFNRCAAEGFKAVVVNTEVLIQTCKAAQPFEGAPECLDVWASGTCTDMLNSPAPCNANAQGLKSRNQLACP